MTKSYGDRATRFALVSAVGGLVDLAPGGAGDGRHLPDGLLARGTSNDELVDHRLELLGRQRLLGLRRRSLYDDRHLALDALGRPLGQDLQAVAPYLFIGLGQLSAHRSRTARAEGVRHRSERVGGAVR